MESICRLCCSTKYVNNHLFDEENALYLKMELYLPIKVRKLDRLPQMVCNRCSLKVNDLYQFCNEAIEAQHRLHDMLRHMDATSNDTSIDLTFTKPKISQTLPPQLMQIKPIKLEQGTQTDFSTAIDTPELEVKVKVEPKLFTPSEVKKEDVEVVESDHCSAPEVVASDSDDNISLVSLKKKKKARKLSTNGEIQKRGRKKKNKMDEWQVLMNSLPESTGVKIMDNNPALPLEAMNEDVDFVFRGDNNLDSQVKKEAGDMELFQCCICLMQCFSRSDMLTHYKQHASGAEPAAPAPPPPPEQQPPRCMRCRKVVEAGEWAAHWARHWERDRRPYRCALCEKTFRDPHQILKHGQTHKGESLDTKETNKRFVCDLCPESFVYMRYLLAHRCRAHPEALGRALALRCALCARQFAHLNSLRRHLRAHSGERNHLCNVCGKALSSREHLKFHIRIHTGYKPNVCKTCGKGFVKKCNLTLHERVHSGEKPHVCSHCGKAFSQRSTLVIHERYHSGARPYACALCGRGFVAKGLLSMHLKTTCI